MESLVDIFGIETDYAIEKEMEERKNKAWAKRREIIDGDILVYLHNYTMLDKMACYPTKETKRNFMINYLMSDIARVRKGPDSSGKQAFAYCEKYKDKPVDREMCVKMANFILDTYSHEEGVRYQRVNLSSDSWWYKDKNGNNVNAVRFENNNIYHEILEKLIREKYPFEDKANSKFYSTDGKSVWTHYAPKELEDLARELRKQDSRYVELVDVD